MERNTLLAIILCGVVLFSYKAIFITPQQAQQLNGSQSTAVQNVSTSGAAPTEISTGVLPQTTIAVKKTIDYVYKTKTSELSYTNMGGSLHNIDFLGNNPFPVTDVLNVGGFENAPYISKENNDGTVSLSYRDNDWQITKTFEMKDQNSIKIRMEIKNLSSISILNSFNFTAFEVNQSRMETAKNNRENGLYEYSVYSNNQIFRKDNAFKFNDKSNRSGATNVSWVGFRDHYNAFIVKPEFETKGYEIKADSDDQLNVSIKPQDKNLAPGESAEYDFSIYLGPQNPWLMKKYGNNFEKIVVFSKYPIYNLPAQLIYNFIPILHRIVRNWGLSIIIVGIIFYCLAYPLTMQSMVSMRKMQEVAPKIKALQERYKNDPQKVQAETMEIYRREKINPFGGCLPVLIQMPFFYALYQVMYRAQYFQGQGFLWIKDLTQPDRLFIFPFSLPLLGNDLNILPILSGCFMFLQQKISSKNLVITDEQQIMQQKMMIYMMPALMAWMFYRFTSGWGLYFVTYYSLSTLTQWRIAKTAGKK